MAKIIFPGSGGTRPVAKYDEICERRIINLKTSPQLDWVLFFNDEENKELVLSADTNPSSAIGRKAEITISYETNDGFICESHNVLLCQKNADSVITTYTYGTAIVNKTVDCVGGEIKLNTINMPYTATTSGVETTGFTSATINSVTVAKCTAATGCTTTGSGNAIPGGTIEYTITQSNCGSLCDCNKLTVMNIGTIPYSGGTYTAATYDNCISNVVLNTSSAPTGMITTSTTSNGYVIVTFGSNSVASQIQCTCSLTYSTDSGSCPTESLSFTQEAAPSPKATLKLSNGTTVKVPCNGDSTLISNDITAVVDASQVVSVHVESCVTKIGDSTFSQTKGFTSLTSITMENSVTEIGKSVHNELEGTHTLKSVQFSNSLTSIGESAFWGCSGLTSLNFPNTLTHLYDSCFRECNGLTSVTIPDSVQVIGFDAFHLCDGLKEVTIGTGWTGTTKNGRSFENCGSLMKVTVKATRPASINDIYYFCDSRVMGRCWKDGFKILVPRNSVGTYKGATYWSNYEDVIEPIS